MGSKVLLACFLLLSDLAASADDEFTFNGFRGANLSLDGTAVITPDGLLRLTNTTKLLSGHAFYPPPLRFRRSRTSGVSSFASTFVFGILSEDSEVSGHGVVFAISPSRDLRGAQGTQYMGLFNPSNNGNSANHVLAVELDTIQNPEFQDINANHVGIDINGMRSNKSSPAGYFAGDNAEFRNLSLVSGDPMQVWVVYDGHTTQLNVTLAPMGAPKPGTPLLSSIIDLAGVVEELMYVGFTSSSDPFLASHYLLGWSFRMNGVAPPALDLSRLPLLPRRRGEREGKTLQIWIPLAATLLLLLAIAAAVFVVRRRAKFAELVEDWELEYGPSRLSYRDLFDATKGFSDKELLGAGGFGTVYRGVLPTSNLDVAVKRVSHESRQGIREFVAEVASIGRLRHRNLVKLQGYCRREGELLLAYDFMPNGSLDKLLFDQTGCRLDWGQRLRIIKGVASALQYLHEEWEQVVIHRDVKASNVLLDHELNARLGDFGLARLYDHGSDPQTTHVVGTLGYLAPELIRRRRATKATDVFAFGVFLLEVVCGRRPVELHLSEEEVVLVEWVAENWKRGCIQAVADPRMGEFLAEEVDLVLRLGLLCCDPLPAVRPNMRRVMQYLDGESPLPEFDSTYLNSAVLTLLRDEALDDCSISYPSVSASLLSGGR